MGTPTHHFPEPARAHLRGRRTGATIGLIAAILVVTVLQPGTPTREARAFAPRASHSSKPAAFIEPSTTWPVPDVTIPPIEHGLAPVLSRIPTTRPVVFLGIDDGMNKQPSELQMLKDNDIHASLFLADLFIHNNPSFFKSFVDAGSLVEDHTLTHRDMRTMTYAEQVKEICGEADLQQREFGRRPILFRPPGGAYNTDTRRAAAACGMRAVVNWIAKANAGSMQYQLAPHLRPGDIVLMHFRPEFHDDMQAFLDAMHAAGLHTELLENWLAPAARVGARTRAF